MKAKLTTIWSAILASYWFFPALMTAATIVLAVVTTYLDSRLGHDAARFFGLLFAGGPEDARQLLNTIATSTMTVAGVTFSVTIVALTLASQQFGPRLLDNFMRDKGTQLVLGTFVATHAYCVIVLRSVRTTPESTFYPQISATVAVGLALVNVGVLIYFIHHVAASIRVTNIIDRVSRDLARSMERYYPRNVGDDPDAAHQEERARQTMRHTEENQKPCAVSAAEDGYLQDVENDELMALAEKHDLIICLKRSPGDFVVECSELAAVWPRERLTKEIENAIRETMAFGQERTVTQDMEFSVMQLVQIAVRALSPGINDPQTAILCLDQLGVALCRLARKDIPSRYRMGEHGRVRVIAEPTRFSGFAKSALDQIRQYGRTSVPVLKRLLVTIMIVAENIRREEDRAELLRQSESVRRATEDAIPDEQDRKELLECYQCTLESLAQSAQPS